MLMVIHFEFCIAFALSLPYLETFSVFCCGFGCVMYPLRDSMLI